VFGKRAGEYAVKCAQTATSPGRIDDAEVEQLAAKTLRPFEDRGGKSENPFLLQGELQAVMQALVGIVRNADDLKAALASIAELRTRAANVKCGGNIKFNPGWHLALDLKNMLDISEAVTRAALERTESRGAHTRDDYPNTEKVWGKVNVVVRQGPDGIDVVREPLSPMPEDLKKLVEGE
jgi:succinate dehydrogenase flavoprotein subunit